MTRRRGKGRVLAVKWGLNPNSSSLGVDVTFLLFGAATLALFTPFVSALVRWRAPALDTALDTTPEATLPTTDSVTGTSASHAADTSD